MELTKEERDQVKAHIGEMLTGEPITDAELENLAEVSPAAFYLTERLILDGKSSCNATNEEMSRALFELMSMTFLEWQRRSG